MNPRILLVGEDAHLLGSIKNELNAKGYDTTIATSSDDGLARAQAEDFALVIIDLEVPPGRGLDLDVVRRLRLAKPRLPVIALTPTGANEAIIDAMKSGADDCLAKPIDMAELLASVAQEAADGSASPALEIPAAAETPGAALVGRSRAMRTLCKEIGRVVEGSATVLIRGPTGSGKELVARAIHERSRRASQPFVPMNCAALPETLFESELFGHERGAFTGAQMSRIGQFERAGRGTIFLDEIGDLNLGLQVKLLRVLQERRVQPLGGTAGRAVQARVLAATHRDLESAIQHGQFREDLYHRLAALTIRAPSLNERLEDLPDLVAYLLPRCASDLGLVNPAILREAVEFLQAQPWPGNVRQLENVLRQALVLARHHPVSGVHVQQACAQAHASNNGAFDHALADFVAGLITRAAEGRIRSIRAEAVKAIDHSLFPHALDAAHGNQAKAARWLGVTRKTLRSKVLCLSLRAGGQGPSHDWQAKRSSIQGK